jgi:hypothetical protein
MGIVENVGLAINKRNRGIAGSLREDWAHEFIGLALSNRLFCLSIVYNSHNMTTSSLGSVWSS